MWHESVALNDENIPLLLSINLQRDRGKKIAKIVKFSEAINQPELPTQFSLMP